MGPIFRFVSFRFVSFLFRFVSFHFPYGVILTGNRGRVPYTLHAAHTCEYGLTSQFAHRWATVLSRWAYSWSPLCRDPLKLEPSRQRYSKHNDRCPAIGCTRPYPRDGIGVSPQMHDHTICMRSHQSYSHHLMNITPCHVFMLTCHSHSHFVTYHTYSQRGYVSCNLPYFMSYNSFSYIPILIQQAIIVQGSHIVTCIHITSTKQHK